MQSHSEASGGYLRGDRLCYLFLVRRWLRGRGYRDAITFRPDPYSFVSCTTGDRRFKFRTGDRRFKFMAGSDHPYRDGLLIASVVSGGWPIGLTGRRAKHDLRIPTPVGVMGERAWSRHAAELGEPTPGRRSRATPVLPAYHSDDTITRYLTVLVSRNRENHARHASAHPKTGSAARKHGSSAIINQAAAQVGRP